MKNRNLDDVVRSINISYLFALNLEHGISYGNSEWKLFEPSKFIYSFFAFNMLYEIDWESKLKLYNKSFEKKKDYSSDKIISLIEFICSHIDVGMFKSYYLKHDPNLSIIEHSTKISTDKNISKNDFTWFLPERKSYLENFKSALSKLSSEEFSIKDVYKLVIFCYQIRNNIFHGMKKATQMIESGQRERLLDYSHILISTMDMFFDVLNKNFDYKLATDNELKENAQI